MTATSTNVPMINPMINGMLIDFDFFIDDAGSPLFVLAIYRDSDGVVMIISFDELSIFCSTN